MTSTFVEASSALPIVHIALSTRTGAATDPSERAGLTRVTARMLRRGAGDLSAHQIEETIDAMGADFGADTGASSTTYFGTVIRRSVEPFVTMMCMLVSKPTFDDEELAKLLREAEAELIEARDNDRGLAARGFRRTLFEGHPYAARSAGTIAGLKAIRRQDVVEHFDRWFRGAEPVIAVSGDVTPVEGEQIAARLRDAMGAGRATPPSVPEPPRHKGRKLVFIDKPDRTQTQMVIGGLGIHPRQPGFFPAMVANTAFGGTFTSRLMREVRSKRGWSYGASSRISYDRQPEAFSMWTAPAASDAAPCLALQLELLSTWRREGITQEELDFVQRYLVRSHAFEIDTAQKRVHQRLDEALCDLPPGFHDEFVTRVNAVGLHAANAAVAAHIPEDDLVIGVVGTHAEIGEAIEKAIPGLSQVTVAPYDLE